MSKQEKLIIIIEESVFKSLVKDTFTFALFAALLWFNHKHLSGSTFIDVLFIVIVMLYMIGRNSSQVFKGKTPDAIKFLEERCKEN